MRVDKAFKITYQFYKETKRAKKIEKKRGHIPYSNIWHLRRRLSQNLLNIMNIELEVIGKPRGKEQSIFVGNHISYIDILVVNTVAPAVFLSKDEVKNDPLYGGTGDVTGIIYVDRENKESRKKARLSIKKYLAEGQSVCIFPAGTTYIRDHLEPDWRWGPFEIAQELDIPITPFRLNYDPLRTVAFVDDDVLFQHMKKLLAKRKINATIEFGERQKINCPKTDSLKVQSWCREFYRNDALSIYSQENNASENLSSLV